MELNPWSKKSDTSPASKSTASSLRPSIKGFWNWATREQLELYAQVPNGSSSSDSGSGICVEVHDPDEIASEVEIWRNSHSMIFVLDSNLEMLVWSEGMTRVGVVWLVDRQLGLYCRFPKSPMNSNS